MNPNFLVNDFIRKIAREEKTEGFINHHESPDYPAWNLMYYILATVLKPNIKNIILETGTHHGISTIIMAQAMKDFGYKGQIKTIERNKENIEQAEINLLETNLISYIQFIHGDSREKILEIFSSDSRLDFAFLDSDHKTEIVLSEFSLIYNLIVESKGYVYFDNTSEGGVGYALQVIKKTYGGNLIHFPNCSWAPPGQAIWSP